MSRETKEGNGKSGGCKKENKRKRWSHFLFVVVMFFGSEKRRYRENFWFGTFDLFVIFDLFGNADGITGTQCLIW
jgi:hypothetical protein